ncbi:hypothetical protein EV182_004841 [Spiromyces aspiralis]|uniref:Uncharacterized protein n=1 Tax=Spiromyces aspiralis TaxID=68401 RepID=A0ACC1HRV4_9FUNG|nr:hypothetical protein EV182_004841 [Spiromyces aspiralis]
MSFQDILLDIPSGAKYGNGHFMSIIQQTPVAGALHSKELFNRGSHRHHRHSSQPGSLTKRQERRQRGGSAYRPQSIDQIISDLTSNVPVRSQRDYHPSTTQCPTPIPLVDPCSDTPSSSVSGGTIAAIVGQYSYICNGLWSPSAAPESSSDYCCYPSSAISLTDSESTLCQKPPPSASSLPGRWHLPHTVMLSPLEAPCTLWPPETGNGRDHAKPLKTTLELPKNLVRPQAPRTLNNGTGGSYSNGARNSADGEKALECDKIFVDGVIARMGPRAHPENANNGSSRGSFGSLRHTCIRITTKMLESLKF